MAQPLFNHGRSWCHITDSKYLTSKSVYLKWKSVLGYCFPLVSIISCFHLLVLQTRPYKIHSRHTHSEIINRNKKQWIVHKSWNISSANRPPVYLWLAVSAFPREMCSSAKIFSLHFVSEPFARTNVDV